MPTWLLTPPSVPIWWSRARRRPGHKRDRGAIFDRVIATGSEIQQEALRVFDAFLQADEEGDRFLAVDDPMIIAERQIHHWADLDLAVHHDRTVLSLVHAQDRGLRRIQDRGGQQR